LDSILHKAPVPPVRLNPDVPSELENIIKKALEKNRELRYQHASEIRTDLQRLKRDSDAERPTATTTPVESKRTMKSTRFRWAVVAGATILIAGLAVGGWLFFSRKAHALTDKDTIVLAEFTNATGDEVFDGTLRQGLSVQLADELGRRFPEDSLVRFAYLPTLHAQIALNRNDPLEAIQVLQTAEAYEKGAAASLYPAYVRGESYLAAHQGGEAAAEFQKILDHRGVVVNAPIGALAHLQLGRAYALQGDAAKARVAYQDFLTLWGEADSDIPILKEAKAEYAKLR
jgi:hypothetical protein